MVVCVCISDLFTTISLQLCKRLCPSPDTHEAVRHINMFAFTSLLGAQTESQAVQSILDFDGGLRILVDVGWDESFDVEKLKELERSVCRVQAQRSTDRRACVVGFWITLALIDEFKDVPLVNVLRALT